MDQKCEGNCGLWVLNEIIHNIFEKKNSLFKKLHTKGQNKFDFQWYFKWSKNSIS